MPRNSASRKEIGLSENKTIAIQRKTHVSLSDIPQVLDGTSRWISIMRQFSRAHKEKCSACHHAPKPVLLPKLQRPTGSTYEGSWNMLGSMSGHGIYTFPNGVVYEGGFQDGEFHGAGELRYDSGVSVKGNWKKGEIVDPNITFNDGLEYEEQDWKYCRHPDRRFTVELDKGFQPAGRSILTADQPTKEVPPGFYDTGYGFYDSINKTVYNYDNLLDLIKFPGKEERLFIENTCRKSPEVSIGPCDKLYEKWITPSLKTEPLPPPSVHTKNYLRKSNSNNLFFGRSTSRFRLAEDNRLSIRSCGGIREFYCKSNLAGGLNARSYSDNILARASNETKTDKIVRESINILSSRSESFLCTKPKKQISSDSNKSVRKSLISISKVPKPANKQLINW